MQNLVWKLILIILILALCAWSLLVKDIRLGKDLRGGVSLIYRVSVPDEPGVDRQSVISQTISVLKDRVNPTGVLDIAIQPLGQDRIEVVMPLPNQEVRGLSDAYKASLNELMDMAQIEAGDLQVALQFKQAEERFCGQDRSSLRCTRPHPALWRSAHTGRRLPAPPRSSPACACSTAAVQGDDVDLLGIADRLQSVVRPWGHHATSLVNLVSSSIVRQLMEITSKVERVHRDESPPRPCPSPRPSWSLVLHCNAIVAWRS